MCFSSGQAISCIRGCVTICVLYENTLKVKFLNTNGNKLINKDIFVIVIDNSYWGLLWILAFLINWSILVWIKAVCVMWKVDNLYTIKQLHNVWLGGRMHNGKIFWLYFRSLSLVLCNLFSNYTIMLGKYPPRIDGFQCWLAVFFVYPF